ncbi:hypothetical protein [uncultured Sneathiella sp.]|jgi:hypothetical protein|uniref:hypothetical protein n=1 Tax=uncultured Sneathiella sp. TaxID=879315 RepID=UPI0030DB33AD|tara:strand:+ start:2116 stop:2337 length:222 start_codon:yes stop_codon:yes gene_type:complete
MNFVDWIVLVFGMLSVFFWLASAFVKWPFGYDMDKDLAKAARKSGWLNAIAATCTAISVATPAAEKLIQLISK